MKPLDWRTKPLPVPDDCIPCRLCGSKLEMYVESPVKGDWYGRGEVWRIGCTCRCVDPDFEQSDRTDFLPPEEAVAEWNEMQKHAKLHDDGGL